MSSTARWAAALGFVIGVTFASVGDAFGLCPNCLGQARGFGSTLRLVGTFLLVPFVVFAIAARLIRRACRTVAPPAQPARTGALAARADDDRAARVTE